MDSLSREIPLFFVGRIRKLRMNKQRKAIVRDALRIIILVFLPFLPNSEDNENGMLSYFQ